MKSVIDAFKRNWHNKPLSLRINDIRIFEAEGYKWVMLRMKGIYFGRALVKEDEIASNNFMIGKRNPYTLEFDYSSGSTESPERMGCKAFGYIEPSSEWVVFYGPWPLEWKFEKEVILIRFNAKSYSAVRRCEIDDNAWKEI
jgi:hypothetical protein